VGVFIVFSLLGDYLRLEADLDCRNQAIEKLMQELSVLQSARPNSEVARQQQQIAFDQDFADLIGVNELANGKSSSMASVAPSVALGPQMVGILQSQRDRYKEKLSLSEAQRMKLQEQVDALQNSRKQLEVDNVSLYSKIKFLSSYNAGQKKSSTSYSVGEH
jgi:multidrug resistance efflux pump